MGINRNHHLFKDILFYIPTIVFQIFNYFHSLERLSNRESFFIEMHVWVSG